MPVAYCRQLFWPGIVILHLHCLLCLQRLQCCNVCDDLRSVLVLTLGCHAEHIPWGGAVAVLCAAGSVDARAGSLCVPHQLCAQPVVKGEAGKA